MLNRRAFLQDSGKALAAARLIGAALAPGMFVSDAVAALKGGKRSVVIPTHEHWGDIDERLDFPRGWEVLEQRMAGHDAPVLSREEMRRRLQAPTGTRPLREIAAGKKSAVVTFDDLTRPTPTYEIAPLVVEELRAAGIPEERIIFLGSYGTHRNMEQDEVARKLGREITRRYSWINHNIFDNLKDIGETSYKNRIRINQTFAAAEVKVTLSGIKVHGGAGYGGGAKAILPGIVALDTTQYNHQTMKRDPKTGGALKIFKNDMRLDMIESARLASVDFSVQIVYNGKRKVCGIFAGDIVEAHHAACRTANKHYRTPGVRDADVVVANAYPQNTQAAHGLSWINSSVREGGTGVLIIQHPQGISSWHYLNERTRGRGGRTYYDAVASPPPAPPKHAQLVIFSQYLDRQQMNKFAPGTLFAFTWAEVIGHLQARHKGDARVAAYPYSCIQHPEVDLA
ncbi:MAG: lactate racemase domain-containing protein [Acidobacteriota bacterium]